MWQLGASGRLMGCPPTRGTNLTHMHVPTNAAWAGEGRGMAGRTTRHRPVGQTRTVAHGWSLVLGSLEAVSRQDTGTALTRWHPDRCHLNVKDIGTAPRPCAPS